MIKKVFLLSLILFLGSTTNASNRVTYTRPGDMLKIPSSSLSRSPYLFQTGFGSEIHNFSPLNVSKGGYFNMETGKSGFLFGFWYGWLYCLATDLKVDGEALYGRADH